MLADTHHIPVYTPKSFKKDADAVEFFRNLKADIGVVAAYGLILPKTVLDAPQYGCLNIHASLLPRWRGAAPIQRAIEAGDTETGITIMQMEQGLDTGPMLLKKSISITKTTIAQSLHDDLSQLGAEMIEQVLENLVKGKSLSPEIQDDTLSCYAPMLRKEEGLIDWTKSCASIDLQIRAFSPWPGCYTFGMDGQRIKILSGEISSITQSKETHGTLISADGDIVCGDGAYRVSLLQPENSKAMNVRSALNGKKLSLGQKWGG